MGIAKQNNNKRIQSLKPIKTEHDITIKSESIESVDNQKKTLHPKTYPSKEGLMLRNVPKTPKSCVFKVHSNKNEKSPHCEQVTLKSPIDLIMPPPSGSKKSNLDFEHIDIKRENCNNLQTESKIPSIHYLSPKEKFETNNQVLLESTKNVDEKMEIDTPNEMKSKNTTGVICYRSSSEDEDKLQFKITSKACEKTLLNENDNSKISGTDFDLNKIRLEMKGLMPTSKSNSLDFIHNSEPLILNKQIETEITKSSSTEDIYEFKDSELCDIQNSSVVDEKQHRVIKNIDQPKLYNLGKPIEFPKVIESTSQVDLIKKSESILPFESNSDSVNSSDNNIEVDTKNEFKENLVVTNELEDSISCSQSENGFSESENLVIIDSIYTNNILENSADESCHIELSESEIKDEVLDFSMKPPETPPNTIFHMPETNDGVIVEEEDYDDDDETKLIIAETDKVDSDSVVCEVHHSSNEQTETKQKLALPLQSIHQLSDMNSECKKSYDIKKDTSLPKDTDDESTVSCNESIQNTLVQNFQMYSHFENQSFMDNDESAKCGYEFESSSKSTTDNSESVVKLSINELTSDNKEHDLKNIQIKDKSQKEYNNILPELQCREEIVDDESFNSALVIEYSRKSADYNIHIFDSIQQPISNNDFYEADNYNDTKTNFFDERQANLVKSVIYDNGPSRSDIFDGNIPSTNSYDKGLNTNQSNIYDNPVPSSSKSCFSPEADVNNVLFCEETIPGSPTGLTEEQFDKAQKKILMAQDGLYEEREAASTMYSMNQSYRRSLLTATNTNDQEDKYINVIQK